MVPATPSPKVSVIVPCYNSEPWLRECLDSVLSQTRPDFEVVVIDDGSTDHTASIAQSYADKRVRYLSQVNQGACAARNMGFALSRGEYINFFDSDDIMHPKKIEMQLAAAGQDQTKSVTGDWMPFRHKPGDMAMKRPPIFRNLTPRDYFELYLNDQGDIPLSAWLVPRTLVEKVGDWDLRLKRDQDGEYAARLMAASSGSTHVGEISYYYRKPRVGSVSQVDSPEKVRSSIIALDAIAQYALQCGVALDNTNISDHYLAILACAYPHSLQYELALKQRISQFGGAKRPPVLGGRAINGLSKMVGWKLARRLQLAFRAVRP